MMKLGLLLHQGGRAGFDTADVTIGVRKRSRLQIAARPGSSICRTPWFCWLFRFELEVRRGDPQVDEQGAPVLEFQNANPAFINYPVAFLALFVMKMLYATMVYGPMAAFLVELFPPQVRYTSISFPYHIGNGIFGVTPPLLVATAIVAATGNIYAGLWYPIAVAGITFVIGALFLRRRRHETV